MAYKILDNKKSILTKKEIEKYRREAEDVKHMWDSTYKPPREEKVKVKTKILNYFKYR